MRRWALLAVLLAAFSSGCCGRMCQHPYDYCGPMDDGCCPPCWHRYGSVFGGASGPMEGETVVYEGAVAPSNMHNDAR